MLRQGANFAELKVWLGDSSLQALERYLHPTDRGKDLANSMRLQLGALSFVSEQTETNQRSGVSYVLARNPIG